MSIINQWIDKIITKADLYRLKMLPITAIIDPQIQTQSGLTKQTGPDIGATAPVDFGFVQGIPGKPTATLYYIEGASGIYSDWLSAIHRPILPNDGNLELDFDLELDSNYQNIAQALEFDTVICINGFNYLCGFQILPSTNQAQLSDNVGGWQTPFSTSNLVAPNSIIKCKFNYSFDIGAKTYTFENIQIGSINLSLPSGQKTQQGKQQNWTDNAIFQVQLDTNGKQGRYSILIDNVIYYWF